MSVAYFTFQSANDVSPLKVRVQFEGFEDTDTPMQTIDRTVGAKLSVNQNGDRAFVHSYIGNLRVCNTAPTGFATLAKVKTWFTSAAEADRYLTVYNDLGVGYFMKFVSPYKPMSLGIKRDSATNNWIIPFELQEV